MPDLVWFLSCATRKGGRFTSLVVSSARSGDQVQVGDNLQDGDRDQDGDNLEWKQC